MDKREALDLLKQAVEEIPHLRTLPSRNGECMAWRDRVSRTLELAYGKDSGEYRRFINAPGKTFIVRTETGQIEDWNWRLDCYESVLESLIK